ncbi:hypothetical protein QE152_g26034 [Popillia japonica]|uniref:Nucleic-acid-binding protein from transposon X-element n=1 Tax=Popillia japonica TaxID=7064 RepID=A0AAW1JZK8_POPJA
MEDEDIAAMAARTFQGYHQVPNTDQETVTLIEQAIDILAAMAARTFQGYHQVPNTDQETVTLIEQAIDIFLRNHPPFPESAERLSTKPSIVKSAAFPGNLETFPGNLETGSGNARSKAREKATSCSKLPTDISPPNDVEALTNRYGILANQDADMPELDCNEQDNRSNAPSELAENDNPSTSERKTQKPPPLCFVTRIQKHYGEFRAKLDNISKDYYIQFAGEKTLVYYRQLSAYKKFIKTYTGSLPFYTYTPRPERTYAYLIKGLHSSVEPDDVRQELLELEIAVKSVDKFKNTRTPIIMENTYNIRECIMNPTKGKYLQHTRVYYEPHINKREIIQCKKCQEWGHATANCFLGVSRCVKCKKCQEWGHATANCFLGVSRCVKCAGNHRSFECEKSRTEPATCCNCGGDHPASSMECSSYKKAIEAKQRRNAQAAISAHTRKPKYQPAPPTVNEISRRAYR